MKFTQEVKDRWLAALRSGDYKQGQHSLCKYGKYCCLGVLGEIEGLLEPLEVATDIKVVWQSPYGYGGELLLGPGEEPYYISMEFQDTLVNLNDVSKCSFEEIADWIERNIPAEQE